MLSASERRRPTGYAVLTEPNGKLTEWDTFRCAHCGRVEHVPPPPNPMPGGTCGACGHAMICEFCVAELEKTNKCVPLEKRLEQIESGERFRKSVGI